MAHDPRSSLDLYTRNAKELMNPQEQEICRFVSAAFHDCSHPGPFHAEYSSTGGTVGRSVGHDFSGLDIGSQTRGELKDGSTALLLKHPLSSAKSDVDQASKTSDTNGGTESVWTHCQSKDSEKSHLNFEQAIETEIVKIPYSKQQVSCPICDWVLLRKSLPRHIRQKHASQQQRLRCALCPMTFVRHDIKARHDREQHGSLAGETGTMECIRCGNRIRDRTLKEHFRTRKCIKAASTQEECQTEFGFSRDSSFFGIETTVDALVVADDLFSRVILFRLLYHRCYEDFYDVSIFDLVGSSEGMVAYREQRRLATRFLTRKLLTAPLQQALLLVYTMLGADIWIFGRRSKNWQCHVEYMQNMLCQSTLDCDSKSRLLASLEDSWRSRFRQRWREIHGCWELWLSGLDREFSVYLEVESLVTDDLFNWHSSTGGTMGDRE